MFAENHTFKPTRQRNSQRRGFVRSRTQAAPRPMSSPSRAYEAIWREYAAFEAEWDAQAHLQTTSATMKPLQAAIDQFLGTPAADVQDLARKLEVFAWQTDYAGRFSDRKYRSEVAAGGNDQQKALLALYLDALRLGDAPQPRHDVSWPTIRFVMIPAMRATAGDAFANRLLSLAEAREAAGSDPAEFLDALINVMEADARHSPSDAEPLPSAWLEVLRAAQAFGPAENDALAVVRRARDAGLDPANLASLSYKPGDQPGRLVLVFGDWPDGSYVWVTAGDVMRHQPEEGAN